MKLFDRLRKLERALGVYGDDDDSFDDGGLAFVGGAFSPWAKEIIGRPLRLPEVSALIDYFQTHPTRSIRPGIMYAVENWRT